MKLSTPPNGWIWLTVYLVLLAGIGVAIVFLRGAMLANLSTQEQTESWQSWREAAAKQDGKHGPVERAEQPSTEPPMRILLRDYFPAVLVSAVVFPGLILGFLLLMLRGVWQQAGQRSPGSKGSLDEQHADTGHR